MQDDSRHFYYVTAALLLLKVVFLSSCESNENAEPIEPYIQHRDYVRLEEGLRFTYKLDSFIYDDFRNTIDTVTYTVNHKVQEKILDSADVKQYQLKRTVLSGSNEQVISSSLYSARLTAEEYQVFRNNQRKLAIKFPLKADSRWDGKAYSSRDSQLFQVKAIHEPAVILRKTYDSTLLIQEKKSENLIQLEAKKTRYAKNVGRVFHENINLRFRGDSIPPEEVPWEEKANVGNIVRYNLKDVTAGS